MSKGFRNPMLGKLFDEIAKLYDPYPQVATTLETIAVILCELDSKINGQEDQKDQTRLESNRGNLHLLGDDHTSD